MTLSISGILKFSPGLGHDANRLAEPHHDRLARLVDGEQRAVADDQGHDDEDGEDAAGDPEFHRVPPAGGCGRRFSSLSGRYGTTPGPAPAS